MTEEAPKGWLSKIGEKAADELSKKLFEFIGTLGIWGALGAWWVAEWSCIRQPQCTIAGWSLGLLLLLAMLLAAVALFLGGALVRAQRKLHAAETQATTQPKAAPPVHRALFQPIAVEDRRLNLRWFIRRPPREWLHWRNIARTVSQEVVHQVLDGPFHAAPNCNAPLVEIAPSGFIAEVTPTSPIFRETCGHCDERVFQGSNVPVWPVRDQTLTELQRMERNGTTLEGREAFEGPVILESPGYWGQMAPPDAQGLERFMR